MTIVRPYVDDDWQAILNICLLAFAPIHQSFERSLGTDLFLLVYPDWKASHEKYLRSLSEPGEKERFFVAEENGTVVGFIHYAVDAENQFGNIGLGAQP